MTGFPQRLRVSAVGNEERNRRDAETPREDGLAGSSARLRWGLSSLGTSRFWRNTDHFANEPDRMARFRRKMIGATQKIEAL